jgi:hypothetical protein
MSVPIPEFSGCVWPVDPACFSDEWEAAEEAVKERALALASATLHRLTGKRVTACPVTVRPSSSGRCFVPVYDHYGTGPFQPGMDVAGQWVNNCGPLCADPFTSVRLPRPVGRIIEVKVDGAVIPATDYRLFEGNRLAYIGTGEGWPIFQNVLLPDTEPDTFSVTYINGFEPDSLAAYAAGLLANEFAKACTGKKCRLPSGVTTIVRQGVSMEIASGLFPNGTTGIREVDAFIALWNPRGQHQPTTILTPGRGISW